MPTIIHLDKTTETIDLGGKGSGFFGHKGRDAENLRGGSVARENSDSEDVITIPVSKVHPTEGSVISKLPNGVRTKSAELDGPTGHGFRWMSKREFKKFANGELKYGGIAENEHERGVMFANAPGDFFFGGGKKEIYLIEVNVQGTAGGLVAPKNSVGLENLVGAWRYNPKTRIMENVIK